MDRQMTANERGAGSGSESRSNNDLVFVDRTILCERLQWQSIRYSRCIPDEQARPCAVPGLPKDEAHLCLKLEKAERTVEEVGARLSSRRACKYCTSCTRHA